ncbi:hypothetical protein ABK040_012947 [Willaertia magna]
MVREGTLFRQEKGTFRGFYWQKYYANLTADRLELCEREGGKVKHTIKIKDKNVSEGFDNFARKLDTFKIEEAPKKIHYFNCNSLIDCKGWMNMLAIHGANPIQPTYHDREDLFGQDLIELINPIKWFEDVQEYVKKELVKVDNKSSSAMFESNDVDNDNSFITLQKTNIGSTLSSGILFVHDRKEKQYFPRLCVLYDNGLLCYYSREPKLIGFLSISYAELVLFTQSEQVNATINVQDNHHLDATVVTEITTIIPIKKETITTHTPFSERAYDNIAKYRFNIVTRKGENIMFVAPQKKELLKWFEVITSFGEGVSTKIKHINQDIDSTSVRDNSRNSLSLENIKDLTKIALSHGQVIENFIGKNALEVDLLKGQKVEILQHHRNEGLMLVRVEGTFSQGLVPSSCISEIKKSKHKVNMVAELTRRKMTVLRKPPERNVDKMKEKLAALELEHELEENLGETKLIERIPEIPPYEIKNKERQIPTPPPRLLSIGEKEIVLDENNPTLKTPTSTNTPTTPTGSTTGKSLFPLHNRSTSNLEQGSSIKPSNNIGVGLVGAKKLFGTPITPTGTSGGIGKKPTTPSDDSEPPLVKVPSRFGSGSVGSNTSTPSNSSESEELRNKIEKLEKEMDNMKKQLEKEKENSEYIESKLCQQHLENEKLQQEKQLSEKKEYELTVKVNELEEKLKQYTSVNKQSQEEEERERKKQEEFKLLLQEEKKKLFLLISQEKNQLEEEKKLLQQENENYKMKLNEVNQENEKSKQLMEQLNQLKKENEMLKEQVIPILNSLKQQQ